MGFCTNHAKLTRIYRKFSEFLLHFDLFSSQFVLFVEFEKSVIRNFRTTADILLYNYYSTEGFTISPILESRFYEKNV